MWRKKKDLNVKCTMGVVAFGSVTTAGGTVLMMVIVVVVMIFDG